MGHLLKPIPSPVGKNFGLVFCKTSRYFLPPFVSDTIIAHRLFSSLSETAYISPLYLYTEHGEEVWKPNLSPDMTRKLTANINRDPTPVEIFDYVYGILHDPVYAEKYEEFLSRDYPRVPIVNVEEDKDNPYAFYVSEALFWEYVHFGSYLRDLHLMNTKVSLDLKIEPNDSENLEIEVVKYSKGELSINKSKKLIGIPEDVWNYDIGGYKVLQKWFKTHKGEIVNVQNFTHIENVAGLLQETINVQEILRKMHNER